MEIIKRREALARGLLFYFTGKPCKHGHLEPRRTKTKVCVDCVALNARKWREKDPERARRYIRERMRRWRAAHLEEYREYQRAYHRAYDPAYRRRKRENAEPKPRAPRPGAVAS